MCSLLLYLKHIEPAGQLAMGFFFAAQYTDSLRSKKSTSHDALRIVLVDFFCKDIKIDIHISP